MSNHSEAHMYLIMRMQPNGVGKYIRDLDNQRKLMRFKTKDEATLTARMMLQASTVLGEACMYIVREE